MKKLMIAAMVLALVACKSATYEWDDGSWDRKTQEEEPETVTVIITIQ